MKNDLQEKVKGPVVVFAKGVEFKRAALGGVHLTCRDFVYPFVEEVYGRYGAPLWKNRYYSRQTQLFGRSLGKGVIVGFSDNVVYVGRDGHTYYFELTNRSQEATKVAIDKKDVADILDRDGKSII